MVLNTFIMLWYHHHHPIPELFSSYKTETIYSLNHNASFSPPPQPLAATILLYNCIILITLVQFSSVTQLCPTLCDPMNCSTPGLPVHHQLTPGVHPNSCPSSQWCHSAISSSVIPFSSCPQSLSALESFPMSQLFTWGGQSTGVSASASVLPMNT